MYGYRTSEWISVDIFDAGWSKIFDSVKYSRNPRLMQGQSTTSLDRRIAEVRAFNRFYTRRIGVVREGYLQTRFSLTEARVLYELAQVDGLTATQIGTDLDPDPGYLSRILQRFAQEQLGFRPRS